MPPGSQLTPTTPPFYIAMFYVYVLKNPANRLYIGSTENLEKRVKQHQEGGARWTSTHRPWELVYSETYLTRAEAMKRERALKSGKANQDLRAFLNQKRSTHISD
jgi:putative endonuclease